MIMTDLMQVLYEYAKEELLPSYLPSPEYREVSRLTARLSLRLRELEAAFQAAFSLARELP